MRHLYEQRRRRAERIIEARSRRQSAAQVVVGGERPRLPVAWSDDVKELLAYAWRGAVWKSSSELGSHASMAWGARNLISTQARRTP